MFLANEKFPRPSIVLLRDAGYTVKSIQEDAPSISDEQVIALATDNRQIILTFDSDYGEIIFRYQLTTPPAVIYFRSKGNSPLFAGQTLLPLLQADDLVFADTFTVIERSGIRQRPYKK